jgi:magnesium transporter
MLTLYGRAGGVLPAPADFAATSLAPDVVWIDLVKPSAGESAFIERAIGLHLPTLEEISEIESSSRLRAEDGALFLSAPLIHRAATAEPQTTPVGFVLTPERLVTVRFETLTAFETAGRTTHGSAAEAFAGLLEAIVDRLADVLEQIAAELDTLSHRLFRSGPIEGSGLRRPARESRDLRAILRRVGGNGDLASKIRDSLLGLSRIVPYVAGVAAPWLPEAVKPRFETMQHDIASLSDYDAHLLNKVQLLLDATLGLINVEQNDIIKVLTIVSVDGVPPTLIASMYGMNFKNIHEYDWAWGYEWGLALIAITAIAPLLWFKWRGWF